MLVAKASEEMTSLFHLAMDVSSCSRRKGPVVLMTGHGNANGFPSTGFGMLFWRMSSRLVRAALRGGTFIVDGLTPFKYGHHCGGTVGCVFSRATNNRSLVDTCRHASMSPPNFSLVPTLLKLSNDTRDFLLSSAADAHLFALTPSTEQAIRRFWLDTTRNFGVDFDSPYVVVHVRQGSAGDESARADASRAWDRAATTRHRIFSAALVCQAILTTASRWRVDNVQWMLVASSDVDLPKATAAECGSRIAIPLVHVGQSAIGTGDCTRERFCSNATLLSRQSIEAVATFAALARARFLIGTMRSVYDIRAHLVAAASGARGRFDFVDLDKYNFSDNTYVLTRQLTPYH